MSKRIYPPEIEKESKRLTRLAFADESDFFDLEKFIEENASQEYKDYMKKRDEEEQELLRKGIMI